MSWLTDVTDRLVLRPSQHPIESKELVRDTIAARDGELEIWTTHVAGREADAKKLLWIKFPGTGGRAENSSCRPANHWPQYDSIVWTVNPFGYGQSCGTATLQRYPEMIELLAQAAKQRHSDRAIVVAGTSLGSISTLSFAARHKVAGMILINPVPIHQMISNRWRYAIPSRGMSRWIAAQIPKELDAIDNAKACDCPCVIVSAQQDNVVPVTFQNQIIKDYAGPQQVIPLPDADHHTPIQGEAIEEYLGAIRWLGESLKLD